MRRIPQLDAIRGIAILLILIWHYACLGLQSNASPYLSNTIRLFSWSWSGVDLFFVLSGFLIGRILINNRDAVNYFQVFYIRRCYRILPVYVLVLSLFLLFRFTGLADRIPNSKWLFAQPHPLWSYAIFLQNFFTVKTGQFGPHWLSVTWSLAIEEQFYLLLPFLVRFVKKPALPYCLLGLILTAPIFRSIILVLYSHVDLTRIALLPCKWDGLLLGVVSAYFLQSGTLLLKLKNNISVLYIAFIITAAITGLILFYAGRDSQAMMSAGFTVLAMFYLCLILIAVLSESRLLGIFFKNSFLIFLGIHSYGIYLYHQIVSGLCHGFIAGRLPSISTIEQFIITVLSFIVTIFAAYLSWNYMEKPLIQLGHRMKFKTSERGVAAGELSVHNSGLF